MKFKINRSLFLEKIQVAQKAMTGKSNLPALSGILLTLKNNVLTLITSNIEFSIKAIVEDPTLEVYEEGKCLVPGKLFGEIIRKLNGSEVSIELEEDNVLRIQSGSSDITLNLLEVEDFPEPNFVESNNPIKIKSVYLKEIIKQTTFAASLLDNKPILTGVNFRVNGNKFLAVATDSFRLSKRIVELDEEFLETNIIVPAKSLNEALKALESDIDVVELHVSENRLLFKDETILFQTRLLDGNYPDTSKLIPTAFPIIVKYDKDDLMSAIDRVSTLSSNPNSMTTVKLTIDERGLTTLTSNSPELGTIKDEIESLELIASSPITVSFSASYFLDAVRAFYSKNVLVKFNGEVKPFIFEGENDENLVELVLPMKTD